MAGERVQRRLAAILAADMVGYSRLMEKDEEGTIARHKAHRAELIDPKFAAHGGRIVKTTGDGLLVEFASAVDAVRCATEIQRAMTEREADVPDNRRIAYRVGINIGDIVIDGDDILGDGVNVAARIEGLAEPGGICCPRPCSGTSRARSTSVSPTSGPPGRESQEHRRAGASLPGAARSGPCRHGHFRETEEIEYLAVGIRGCSGGCDCGRGQHGVVAALGRETGAGLGRAHGASLAG